MEVPGAVCWLCEWVIQNLGHFRQTQKDLFQDFDGKLGEAECPMDTWCWVQKRDTV